MIAVNGLANALPINGLNTGEASDAYPNLFAPAGMTFAIWGVIYLLLAAYVLYQFGAFQNKDEQIKGELLNKVGLLFAVSSLANAAWIFAWHYQIVPVSLALIVAMLFSLILINGKIRKEKLSLKEKFFIQLPFSIYFGWLTVATIANATTLFVRLDWQGFGLSEVAWTVIILVVGLLIGVATMIYHKSMSYGFVLLWAYFGILTKHVSPDGFSGQYPPVITTLFVCLSIFAIAEVYLVYLKRKQIEQ
ncbi:MAG: tryptophan-rich sensory protein [Clostridia bacterium]|nr:tryptophan-rich sensory protein [Clostridia bacterium]